MALSGRRPSRQEQEKDRLSKDLDGGEEKRLNVVVPFNMYKEMKRQAVEEDRSISEITRELWREYLRKQAGVGT